MEKYGHIAATEFKVKANEYISKIKAYKGTHAHKSWYHTKQLRITAELKIVGTSPTIHIKCKHQKPTIIIMDIN